MDPTRQRATFAAWLEAHKGLLFKVVRAYATTPADRDDLFQEIALQVWRSIPVRRGESAVSTWIYRVALYAAIAWRRQERKHRDGRHPLGDAVDHALVEAAAPDERLEWLYEQIGRLDEVDRSVMLLALDGLSYREMAAILGISESHVGVKLTRIRKRLSLAAEEMKPHGL